MKWHRQECIRVTVCKEIDFNVMYSKKKSTTEPRFWPLPVFLVINTTTKDTQSLSTELYDVLMANRVKGVNNKLKKWSVALEGEKIRTNRSI